MDGPACAEARAGRTRRGVGTPPREEVNEPVVPGLCRFPRTARFTRKAEFQFVFKHGEKGTGARFVCYWSRREARGNKLGVAVSRKVGKAVVRNRIKRYVREFYRTHSRFLRPDVQLVVVARPGSAEACYRDCAEEVGRLLRSGGVLDDQTSAR